jgi:hypothetical protein
MPTPHARLPSGQAIVGCGHAGVCCGQFAVSNWQIRLWQTGPTTVQTMPQDAAGGTVQACVAHGTKGVWQFGCTMLMQGVTLVQGVGQVTFVGHGPRCVQNGAQVGLTDAHGWQVARCVWHGVKCVQAMPQVFKVHACDAIWQTFGCVRPHCAPPTVAAGPT